MIKSYNEYKLTPIMHLPEIPLQWECWKLKYLVKQKLKYGANESAELDDTSFPRYIRITDFDSDGKLRDDTFKSLRPETAREYLLKEGDVLFARSGATVGKSFQFKNYEGEACFAGYLIMARPDSRKILSDYLYYFTKTGAYTNWINSIFIQATIQNVGGDKYSIIEIPKATLSEQQKIAVFLDHKTALIDKFITNRKKQIELLEEKKAAIINKAVTKGINPNVKLKPSGVDWIWEIPEHWEVSHLRRFLNLLTDFSANGSFADLRNNVEYLDYDDYARLVRLTDLRDNFNNSGVYVNKHAYNFLAKSSLQGEELLMANVGAYAGFVCLMPQVEFKATLGPNMFIIKLLNKKYTSEYAYYLLSSDLYNSILSLRALSSAQPKLNKEDIKSLPLIRPTIEEQDVIVAYLKKEFIGIVELILKYQKQIDLIQEYKTALISKAVTGKIDVREWQKPINSILNKTEKL